MYRARPCLWEVKSKDYSNRNLRNSAYESLIEKCKQIKPDADKSYVVKKINSLRASFRRQFRKIQDGRTSTGNAAEDVPEPTLWYYELLMFTLDQDAVRPGMSSRSSRENLEDEPSEETDATNETESAVSTTFLFQYFTLLF